MTASSRPPVAGVVLAGGLSSRMGGGDKCLLPLAGRALLAHVVERAAPQVAVLALSANGDPRRFAAFGLPVIADGVGPSAGPLAGVLAAMEWVAATLPGVPYLATFPGDGPFLPLDLVARLRSAVEAGAQTACAASGGRIHPLYALWPVALRDGLRAAVVQEGVRKVDVWARRLRRVEVCFAAMPVDPFFNINRPEDLSIAKEVAAAARS